MRFIWPIAGVVVALLAVMIPSKPGITLHAGIAAWCAAMLLVLILSSHPIGARIGALWAGLFMAVPCFVRASPLSRLLLVCFMALPLAAAAALVLAPPIAGFRARLAHLCTWCGTRHVKPRVRRFDAKALQNLMAATVLFAAAIAVVKQAPAIGFWMPVRWIAGGIAILALAEMATAGQKLVSAPMGLTAPPFFQSPHRSTSISEFWAQRWNLPASELFRKNCFFPLARRGAALALFITFTVSAVGHALLVFFALGRLGIALVCGAFFLVQPLVILAEQSLNVRRWRPAAGWAWTLAILTITSPLIVEPALQILESGWGAPDNVLLPTAAALGFVTVLSSVISLASLASLSADDNVCAA